MHQPQHGNSVGAAVVRVAGVALLDADQEPGSRVRSGSLSADVHPCLAFTGMRREEAVRCI